MILYRLTTKCSYISIGKCIWSFLLCQVSESGALLFLGGNTRGHLSTLSHSRGLGGPLLPVNTGPTWAWWDLFFFSWPCFSKASCPFTCSTFQVLLKMFTAFNKTNKSGGTNVSHYPTTPPVSFPSPSLLGHFSAGLAWSPGIRDRGKKWIGKDTG